jgi:hypothetical protein
MLVMMEFIIIMIPKVHANDNTPLSSRSHRTTNQTSSFPT